MSWRECTPYQLMRTGTGASARSLIVTKTSVCNTMSTPAGNGVLRLLTHVVVWPLSVLVTVSVDPHGASAVVHGLLGAVVVPPEAGPARGLGRRRPRRDDDVDDGGIGAGRWAVEEDRRVGRVCRRRRSLDWRRPRVRRRRRATGAAEPASLRLMIHNAGSAATVKMEASTRRRRSYGVHCGDFRPWDVEKATDEYLGTQGMRSPP